jgi:ribosome-associated protein
MKNKMLKAGTIIRPALFHKSIREVVLVTGELETERRVLLCIKACLEKKAKNVLVMEVSEFSSFTDFFLICSGTSSRHVQAIAAFIQENMKKAGILPLGVEGETVGTWVLLDYDDVIVHVFYEPVREFYDIERLWPDAPRSSIEDDAPVPETLSQRV